MRIYTRLKDKKLSFSKLKSIPLKDKNNKAIYMKTILAVDNNACN